MYKLCRRRVAVLTVSLLLVLVFVLASLGLGLHTSCVRTVAEVNTQLASYGLGGARCGKQRLDTAADCNTHQARARERSASGGCVNMLSLTCTGCPRTTWTLVWTVVPRIWPPQHHLQVRAA